MTGVVLAYLVTVFCLVTLNFLLPRVMPGDPVSALADASAPTYVSDGAIRGAVEQYYGLDHSLVFQYGHYLGQLARGDLGTSIRYNVPVADLVAERLPWSLLLASVAQLLATAVGGMAGVHSAWHRDRPIDRGLLSVFLGARNFPIYFLGSLSVFIFAVKLNWFPLGGASTPFSGGDSLPVRVGDVAWHLTLPALVLALVFAADHYLFMRAAMVSEMEADYLFMGRAKGLRDRRLKYRYAARNSLAPMVTQVALQAGFMVTGSIFVETVFAYPGIGRLLFDSITYRDYPSIQACFLVLTLLVISSNFLADVAIRRLDPKARG